MKSVLYWGVVLALQLMFLAGCGHNDKPTVVLYCAQDEVYAEPILQDFEKETGIKVQTVYDTEAAKTVGLINRIIAERNNPQCDVLWNNEIARTLVLQREDLLEPYTSPSAQDVPAAMKDPKGYWVGFAARARVLICNTNLLEPARFPTSILELTNAQWKGKVAMAYPMFGTTATHASALFTLMGDEPAKAYFRNLHDKGLLIADGNAAVKDMVVRGEVPVGFTDTDDALVAIQQGKPVSIVFPDQGANEMGTLVIPNTLALVKNCPHADATRRLIDFLLTREVERKLAFSGSGQMPVREGIPVPPGVRPLPGIKAMPVDWGKTMGKTDEVANFMNGLFVR